MNAFSQLADLEARPFFDPVVVYRHGTPPAKDRPIKITIHAAKGEGKPQVTIMNLGEERPDE